MAKRPRTSIPRWLHAPVYQGVRAAVAAATLAPPGAMLPLSERLGRGFGDAPFNRKRLGRAVANIRVAFPSWDEARAVECARAAYGHLFRLGLEISYAPRLLSDDAWIRHLSLGDIAPAVPPLFDAKPTILISGHCGNWEMLGYTLALLGFPMHALYRPLDLPPLDRWVRSTRERRGMRLVDKFGALRQLPPLVASGVPVGFVADQNAGDRGLFVPFFNRLASTYKSIGLLALQFGATVVVGGARRVREASAEGLGYRIEVADVFGPEEWSGHPDPLYYVTARYRRGIETLIRRAPEQYLWMHRAWRSRPRHERSGKAFPGALEEKLRLLPWVGEGDLAAIKEHSARDARTLAETGLDRLS